MIILFLETQKQWFAQDPISSQVMELEPHPESLAPGESLFLFADYTYAEIQFKT